MRLLSKFKVKLFQFIFIRFQQQTHRKINYSNLEHPLIDLLLGIRELLRHRAQHRVLHRVSTASLRTVEPGSPLMFGLSIYIECDVSNSIKSRTARFVVRIMRHPMCKAYLLMFIHREAFASGSDSGCSNLRHTTQRFPSARGVLTVLKNDLFRILSIKQAADCRMFQSLVQSVKFSD